MVGLSLLKPLEWKVNIGESYFEYSCSIIIHLWFSRGSQTHTYWFVSGQTRTGPKNNLSVNTCLEQCQKSPEASSIVHEACVINDALIFFPICSMYGIFTYIWVFFGANVGKYSIHGAYGFLRGSKFGHLICHGNLFSKSHFSVTHRHENAVHVTSFAPVILVCNLLKTTGMARWMVFRHPSWGKNWPKNPTYLDSYLGHNRKSVLNS